MISSPPGTSLRTALAVEHLAKLREAERNLAAAIERTDRFIQALAALTETQREGAARDGR